MKLYWMLDMLLVVVVFVVIRVECIVIILECMLMYWFFVLFLFILKGMNFEVGLLGVVWGDVVLWSVFVLRVLLLKLCDNCCSFGLGFFYFLWWWICGGIKVGSWWFVEGKVVDIGFVLFCGKFCCSFFVLRCI